MFRIKQKHEITVATVNSGSVQFKIVNHINFQSDANSSYERFRSAENISGYWLKISKNQKSS